MPYALLRLAQCNAAGQSGGEGSDVSSSTTGVAKEYKQYSQGAWNLSQRVGSGNHIQHAVAMTYLPGAPDWYVCMSATEHTAHGWLCFLQLGTLDTSAT
jgi:hypothetical protein